MPVDADGVGSQSQVVVYWPAYFPHGSHLSVHIVSEVAALITLDQPPTKWTGLDQIAEDTAPPSADDKTSALVALIAQVEAQGGDATVLKAIADDAKITLPDPKVDPAPAQADPSQLDAQRVDAPA